MTATIEHDDESEAVVNKIEKQRQPRDLKPCERCKAQHLKCVYPLEATKCQRCERSGHSCVRSTRQIKFRDVTVSKLNDGRSKRSKTSGDLGISIIQFENGNSNGGSDQLGGKQEDPGEKKLISRSSTINQTESMMPPAEMHTNTGPMSYPGPHNVASVSHKRNDSDTAKNGTVIDEGTTIHEKWFRDLAFAEQPERTPTASMQTYESLQDHFGLERMPSLGQHSNLSFGSPARRWESGASAIVFLDDMVKTPHSTVAHGAKGYLETILLRYWREELAPWFDICDPGRHFVNVLPRMTREPGPLRSAILTIAARNLSHNQRYRLDDGTVQWRQHLLPDLTEELAMSYHNECIRELLHLSLNQEKLHDESLLAAVVTLRTDEEMLHEPEDQQLFLKISSLFIDAQLPSYLALPHSSPKIFHPAQDETAQSPSSAHHSAHQDSDLGSSGLRQACFWTAFRQDLHAAFMKQQSVRFPIARCEAFRQLHPATDAVWANRMVTFCADVLEFCYGSDSVDGRILPAYTNRERWEQLRSHEERLCALLPSSFEPTYCCEPNTARGEVFPSLFYLETIHVAGTTYVELAKMLLGVFNPARPRLGRGCVTAMKEFTVSTKKLLFRLCGIALSNSRLCPPGLVNASLGIALFGEYFEDPAEQDALMSVLSLMIQRYNYYPATQIANALRKTWFGSNDEETPPASPGNMDMG